MPIMNRNYWTVQQENLRRVFARKVKERIEQKEIKQLSVFALAPQPLLIELGHLSGGYRSGDGSSEIPRAADLALAS